ncbi:MAG: hypothetical protein HYT11_04195 [Candidatus Levybacteria bacterium]|nr:hypothetical protein [Candidatus Levybacteria bacterium]
MATTDTGQEQKTQYPENPYLKSKDKEDIHATIFATLADLTNPQSIIPLIRNPNEAARSMMRENEISGRRTILQLEDNRLKRELTLEEKLKREEELARYRVRLVARDKEGLDHYIRRELEELLKTSTMIEIRDAAQKLYQQFTESNVALHSTAEAHMLRRATALWEKMHQFSQDFLEYKSGFIRIRSLKQSPEAIITHIREKAAKAIAMQSEEQGGKTRQRFGIHTYLPIESPSLYKWDSEEIGLTLDKEGKILFMRINELFSHTQYCQTPEDLHKAYKNGQKLTPSQLLLLKDHGYELAGAEVFDDHTLGVIRPVLEKAERAATVPMAMFAFSLPSDLTAKIKGKSQGDSYATNLVQVGPFQINTRLHDYGEMQYAINLDTSNLTKDEGYRLVKQYVSSVQAFPRTPLVK